MRIALLVATALSLTSCSIISSVSRGVQSLVPGNGGVTQEELRGDLLDFASGFSILVTEAADRIAIETTAPKIRRLSLLWKIRLPPLAQDAASDPNPRTGYVEILTVAVAQRQFFDEGAGKDIFGPQQEIARVAGQEIEQIALRLGSSFLSEAQLSDLHGEVSELAKAHPIRGEFLRESIQAGLSKAESGGAFDDIIGIPMAPFRAIAGVESGAQAIHEFNATAAQFTGIIDQLPQRMRWQMELLSYDLQEQGGVLEQSLSSMASLAESADRLSMAADRAPKDVRDTIKAMSEELERNSVTLNTLLTEYREAMVTTGTTAAGLNDLVAALARTSEQLNQAGVAWNALITQLNAPSPPPPPGTPPSPPFNILDYERTALAIHATAGEVRGLIDDVQKAESDITTPVADRLLRDGIILILVFFAGLIGYRLISARIARAG